MHMLPQRWRAAMSKLALLAALLPAAQATSAEPVRLEQVNGNLYRFSNGQASGVLLIGENGVVVGDPLDQQTAIELKQLLAEQFSLPVRYVFYSHAALNRVEGAAVFAADGALIIAHTNSMQIKAIQQGTLPTPDIVFNDTLQIGLSNQPGPAVIELRHLGKSSAADMIIAYFPQHDAVYAADFIAVDSLQLQPIEKGFFPDWFAAINKLGRIDFSYLLPGEGEVGIRSDATEHGHYLHELYNRVNRRLKAGQNAEQIVAETNLRRFKQWRYFDQARTENVQGMLNAIKSANSDE